MRQLISFALLAAASLESQADLFLHTNFKCVSPTERREVHIYRRADEVTEGSAGQSAINQEPICRVDYLKESETETLWTAQSSVEFCEIKADELTDKLEATNFKCISTATFEYGASP